MLVEEALFKEAFVILQNAKALPKEINDVVELVVESAKVGRYVVNTGIGKNELIAQKAAATYNSLSIPSFFLDAYCSLHGDLGMITPGQLIIAYSKSGSTPELLSTFEACGKRNTKLVSITCTNDSALGKIAKSYNGLDIVLSCEFEADKLNVAPTCSSTLFIAIADAIGCAAAFRLGLTKEQFLANHPNGSLGNQLREELGQ